MAGIVGIPTVSTLSPEGSMTCSRVTLHPWKKNTEIPQDCWTQS